MDQLLIDYVKSGKAWLLVGSGPSIAMGYPSWVELAEEAIFQAKSEMVGKDTRSLENAMRRKDYPAIFDEAQALLGGPRLLQLLQAKSKSSNEGRIYELIARWPISVYMTTNYDNEIAFSLAQLGESYKTYSNSEDHLALLTPALQGAVIKLHGDLTSEQGLILTKTQYREIQEDDDWAYWRVKMTSVFQMLPVIIIGHSLTDVNIKHVLEAAKKGAGVIQPVCWIAPDIAFDQRREYLEKYRIRVIPYPNQSGDHRNLVRLVENISDFIPPRLAVRMQQRIADISVSPLGESAAAPGFFVYNKLFSKDISERKRVDILLAVIESTVPQLKNFDSFTLQEAFETAGWPSDVKLDSALSDAIEQNTIRSGILEKVGTSKFKLGKLSETVVKNNQQAFEHSKERFKHALFLRIKRKFPSISNEDASQIASDIEASLIGYFREGGLSLTTTLFCDFSCADNRPSVPSSIVRFITEASTRYDDTLKRQAFCTISVDAFVYAESAERDYLGRIAQGFFAFHALGVYGDVAIERLSHAKDTVWLVDSNVQIGLLALSSSSNALFRDCFKKLRDLGIRLFTTEKLFNEIHQHFYFADKLIETEGQSSPSVLAAALGDPPYTRSNAFLEGFVNWQTAANPCDWKRYFFDIFGNRRPQAEDINKILREIGIEVIDFQDWPGFNKADFEECDEYASRIVARIFEWIFDSNTDYSRDPYKKARPESESLLIIKKEREGLYNVISEPKTSSPSWFISDTSVLNIIDPGTIITWQPESFVRFILSLAPIGDAASADCAFESLLLSIARSGVSIIDDQTISMVFGGVIDQSRLNIREQRQQYQEALESKYGESAEDVLQRLSPRYQPLAAIQLAEERAQAEAARRERAEKRSEESTRRAKLLEKDVKNLERFRKKYEERRERAKREKRKHKSKKKKK